MLMERLVLRENRQRASKQVIAVSCCLSPAIKGAHFM